MLTEDENRLLTEVGPGTPCGELLRRYWQPVCYAEDLASRPTLRVKMLEEDLVVYRDAEGNYGLLAEHCSHRGTSLAYGFVQENCTLRCPYHGWKYDSTGKIVEQPFESKGSVLKERIRHTAYPVEELSGIVFGYMGPDPAPLLPRWDVLVRQDGELVMKRSPVLDCNWLQAQENSADTVHTYFLHSEMLKSLGIYDHPGLKMYSRRFVGYGFRLFEWGLLKSFVTESNGIRKAEIGNPLIFPNMLRVRDGAVNEGMHWRVPIDREHTRIFWADFRPSKDAESAPRSRFPRMVPTNRKFEEDGTYVMDDFFPQDWMAWETQGPIFDRGNERLGSSDRGIVMYRRMLRRNIEAVRKGDEPMALVRDPSDNLCINFSTVSEEPLDSSDWYIELEDPSGEEVSTSPAT